ncbi:MAG: PIG-L family deacetylase [Candidatus Omnitrophota bacterium]
MIMKIKIFLLTLIVLCISACATLKEPPAFIKEQISGIEPFKKGERILILAPHPDDESIGCAGIIQQALAAGARVKVLYLTNGDHNELAFIVYEKRLTVRQGVFIYMGQVRRAEAIKAMALLGLKENDLIFLGYPDFGTFAIFSRYWQAKKPFRDKLTRISSVPYKNDLSYGAPYQGESILSDLEKVLLDYKPNRIFSSHPADVNVDHKSFYLFLKVALSDLKGQIPEPKLYPYLIHWLGWPVPRHYHPALNLYPPEGFWSSQIKWSKLDLSSEELQNKYRAILAYKSQTQVSAFYLLAFARKNELFGDYPDITLKPQSSDQQGLPVFLDSTDTIKDITETDTLEPASANTGQVSYAVVDNDFLVHVEKQRKFSRLFGVRLYLFGYSSRTRFALMPKISVITSGNRYRVFSSGQRISAPGVSLKLDKNTFTLRIPLKLLGDPDYILTALRSYKGRLAVDATGFRKVWVK